MSLKNYQEAVDTWVREYTSGYWTPHEILARLTEEVGEVARVINHEYGPKKKKSAEPAQDVGEELADILFASICLANSLHIDLDESFQKVMDKVYRRDSNRFKEPTP